MIARCQPGYFFLPSLSVLLIFLPPAVHVQDGTDGAGQVGRGTQDFKKQVHRPLQSEIEALPADGFRGGQILTERDGACMPCRHRVQPDTYLATRSVCARTHILHPQGRGNSADSPGCRTEPTRSVCKMWECVHIPAPATGVAGLPPDRHRACRQGPESRAADSPGNREPQRRWVRDDGGGQGPRGRAAHRTGARRPPAGPQNFWLRQKFNCATFGKSSKTANVRVFCGRKKEGAWKD